MAKNDEKNIALFENDPVRRAWNEKKKNGIFRWLT